MVQKLKLVLASIAMALGIALPVAVPVYAQEINKGICAGAQIALGTDCTVDEATAGNRVSGLIKQVINIISIIVGVVAVIMIIIGGLRYITSGGDSSSVSSAKNTILYAIVGLVVVALAQLIVQFVITKLNAAPTV